MKRVSCEIGGSWLFAIEKSFHHEGRDRNRVPHPVHVPLLVFVLVEGGEVVEGVLVLYFEEVVDTVTFRVADSFEDLSWADFVDGDGVLQSSQDAIPGGERPLVGVARFVGLEEGVKDDGVGFALDFCDESDLFQALVGCPGSTVPIDYSSSLD